MPMDPSAKQISRAFERRLAEKEPNGAALYEVIQRARSIFSGVARSFPPTDLAAAAVNMGVREIRYVPLYIDGRVVQEGGRYVIEVNSRGPQVRKRFTIAHELGHLILSRSGALGCSTIATRGRRVDKSDQREEELCDAVAKELLVPIEWARDFAGARDPSFSAIELMAKVCQVSREVAARRLLEAGWRCRLLWWSFRQGRFQALRAYPAYDQITLSGMGIPDWTASILAKVLRDGKPLAGDQEVVVEGERELYRIESWRANRETVACLLIYDRKGRSPSGHAGPLIDPRSQD
jgi:Zn-dependent peptidase ImmA (M78 family)